MMFQLSLICMIKMYFILQTKSMLFYMFKVINDAYELKVKILLCICYVPNIQMCIKRNTSTEHAYACSVGVFLSIHI